MKGEGTAKAGEEKGTTKALRRKGSPTLSNDHTFSDLIENKMLSG